MDKYFKCYLRIVERAKRRTPPEEGEKHHIEPRCIAPHRVKDPTNIVKLTFHEHFLAHWLLTKTDRYREDAKIKLCFAFANLRRGATLDGTGPRVLTGLQYKKCREMFVLMARRPRSKEFCEKLSRRQIGVPKPQSTRDKISRTMSGRRQSPELVERRIAPVRGRKELWPPSRMSAMQQARRRRVTIDGVTYLSAKIAMETLGVTRKQFYQRYRAELGLKTIDRPTRRVIGSTA